MQGKFKRKAPNREGDTARQVRSAPDSDKREKGLKAASAVERPPVKRVKVSSITLDKFAGDVAAWFEALHDFADPKLSKLERSVSDTTFRLASGSAWDIVKVSAKAALPGKGEGPFALVVSASADRSCVIAKDLRKCPGVMAKLFARHMKVPEQGTFLKSNSVGPAVGTPNRLLKLCEDGLLELSKLKYLIVDMHVDSKSFTVLSLPEVSRDFFSFFRKFISPLAQGVEVVLLSPGPEKPTATRLQISAKAKPSIALESEDDGPSEDAQESS